MDEMGTHDRVQVGRESYVKAQGTAFSKGWTAGLEGKTESDCPWKRRDYRSAWLKGLKAGSTTFKNAGAR